MATNISISDELWVYLNNQKGPGDTFEDVIRRQIGYESAAHAAHAGGRDE